MVTSERSACSAFRKLWSKRFSPLFASLTTRSMTKDGGYTMRNVSQMMVPSTRKYALIFHLHKLLRVFSFSLLSCLPPLLRQTLTLFCAYIFSKTCRRCSGESLFEEGKLGFNIHWQYFHVVWSFLLPLFAHFVQLVVWCLRKS